MGGVRILSDLQIDEMAELRERGWTYKRIAEHFTARGTPVSQGSIGWQCLRVGADIPIARRKPHPSPGQPVQRGTHLIRPFLPDEDQRLLTLEQQGLPIAAIGRALGRRQNSVRGRLMILARHDARLEEAHG